MKKTLFAIAAVICFGASLIGFVSLFASVPAAKQDAARITMYNVSRLGPVVDEDRRNETIGAALVVVGLLVGLGFAGAAANRTGGR